MCSKRYSILKVRVYFPYKRNGVKEHAKRVNSNLIIRSSCNVRISETKHRRSQARHEGSVNLDTHPLRNYYLRRHLLCRVASCLIRSLIMDACHARACFRRGGLLLLARVHGWCASDDLN